MTREEVLGLLESRVAIATEESEGARRIRERAEEDERQKASRREEAEYALSDMKALYEKEARGKARPARPDPPTGEMPEPTEEGGR